VSLHPAPERAGTSTGGTTGEKTQEKGLISLRTTSYETRAFQGKVIVKNMPPQMIYLILFSLYFKAKDTIL
jgi:hypothetical protein